MQSAHLRRVAKWGWPIAFVLAGLLGAAGWSADPHTGLLSRSYAHLAEHLHGILAGLAVAAGLAGVALLNIWLCMPRGRLERRVVYLYLGLVIVLAAANAVVHLRLGYTNLHDQTIYAKPWTATGWPSVLITRVLFEDFWEWHLGLWPVLPFGLLSHACLWSPLLCLGTTRVTAARAIVVQAVLLAAWIGGHVMLAREVYRFYA